MLWVNPHQPLLIRYPLINNVVHNMELDSGAAVTLTSETVCKQLFPDSTLRVLLRTYSGEHLPVVGEINFKVQYEKQVQYLVLTIMAGEGLLGRNWLQHLKLNWREIRAVANHQYPSKSVPVHMSPVSAPAIMDTICKEYQFCATLMTS
jgi:hypothetical protein